MIKDFITMDLPIESVYDDYKLVADSIVDDESFQKADTGILLSHLYDVVKVLEKQIPKKPIIKTNLMTKHVSAHCSICDTDITYYSSGENYCHNCGQAIKWE